jgi:DNA-directed RNA polymerase specialized sigma24 family protein
MGSPVCPKAARVTGRHELDGLPETYALALRLRDEGLDDAAIGRVLDIERESVGPLLDLALSKLAALQEHRPAQPSEAGADLGPGPA